MFQWYVAYISYRCCKSRSGCCICCNGCTLMLQTSVPNVLSVFSDVCCKCVYLNVAYVSHICCKCFIWMLCMLQWFSSVFSSVFTSFSEVCFKYFICLQTYIASITSGCFKSRSGLAHVAMSPPAVVARGGHEGSARGTEGMWCQVERRWRGGGVHVQEQRAGVQARTSGR
jgi:hypothetical protein